MADYEQHLLIKDIFQKKHRKAGWRVIKMNLERQTIIMNHKKIRRLMQKYGSITQIRRRNPYKQIAKATQEHRGTDITYLYDGNGQRPYLSIILDMASGEIVTHHVSASLGMDLSLTVIRQAATRLGKKKLNGVMIHSDHSLDQVKVVVNQYIHNYNHHRYQWARK